MRELQEETSLLAKFVRLARYFSPRDQLDKHSPFSCRTVNAEQMFSNILSEFNPYRNHQDCHEFLVLLLDKLNEEMALIHKVDPVEEEKTKGTGEWQEVGSGNLQKRFNNNEQSLSQASLINDIFGGLIRTEFHVEGRKHTNVSFEPFFVLNLEISRCEDIEDCLSSFFEPKPLSDYKDESGKEVRAWHTQMVEKLPNILILQLKRFVYKERPIKMKEDIDFPEVVRIEDKYVSNQFKARTGGSKGVLNSDYSGREYRLFSVINHKGLEATKGHYVCWVLDSNNQWILYDDDKVKKAATKDSVLFSQAYILFYEKISE